MHVKLTEHSFIAAFQAAGRADGKTHEGMCLLFNHLEECDDVELDVVAIDCEFTELSANEIETMYNKSLDLVMQETVVLGPTQADTYVIQLY